MNKEDEKTTLKNITIGLVVGIGIASVIWMIIHKSKTEEMKEAILKLEGWQ